MEANSKFNVTETEESPNKLEGIKKNHKHHKTVSMYQKKN